MPLTTRPDLSEHPLLSREQVGHVRHIHNLASLPLGQWSSYVFTDEVFTGQEFADALRYQLATMTYAMSVAHYHRLPALRSAFRMPIRKLIAQMLRKEVWGYWFNASMSGIAIDPDLKELRKPWSNPVVRENIMYSGHLLLMTSLYGMLFDDDEFEQDDSIVFTWDPIFWGMGPEIFKYSNRSLQQAILNEMERENWLGVCCEPNNVFVVCNQFPIIAMRYNDVRDGTNQIEGILELYLQAWEEKGGMAAESGFVRDAYMIRQKRHRDASEWAFSSWNNAFMHAWNSEFVEEIWEKQALGSLVNIDDGNGQYHFIINPPEVAIEYRKIVAGEGANLDTPEIQARAVQQAKVAIAGRDPNVPIFPYKKPMFGYAVQFLSELPGRKAHNALSSLLAYADTSLNPQWDKGGLYYPHNSEAYDEDMNWKFVSPYDGNAAIAYARLNVVNGQKIMWDYPWTRTELQQRPYIDDISLADGVDFHRGAWDEDRKLLVVTVRAWDGLTRNLSMMAKNLMPGSWDLWLGDGACVVRQVDAAGSLKIDLEIGDKMLDIILKFREH